MRELFGGVINVGVVEGVLLADNQISEEELGYAWLLPESCKDIREAIPLQLGNKDWLRMVGQLVRVRVRSIGVKEAGREKIECAFFAEIVDELPSERKSLVVGKFGKWWDLKGFRRHLMKNESACQVEGVVISKKLKEENDGSVTCEIDLSTGVGSIITVLMNNVGSNEKFGGIAFEQLSIGTGYVITGSIRGRVNQLGLSSAYIRGDKVRRSRSQDSVNNRLAEIKAWVRLIGKEDLNIAI